MVAQSPDGLMSLIDTLPRRLRPDAKPDEAVKNACSRRSTTSSILAGPTLFNLTFVFGTFCTLDGGRPPSRLLSAPRPAARGFSAVTKFSLRCRPSSLTGTAFPPPDQRAFRVALRFPAAFGTMRSSDSCRVIDFRPFVLRPAASAEPGRSHWVRPKDFVTIPSPIRPWNQRISGLRRCSPTCPPRTPHGASLSLETITHLRLLPDTPSRVPVTLAGPGSLWCSRSVPLPHRCQVPFVRALG